MNIIADLLNIFIPVTTLIQVVVALLLILVVLMQRPKQEGLGATFGAGMTDQMFGAQTTSVLQKATVFLGITFVSSTLILAIMVTRQNTTRAIQTDPIVKESPAAEVPSLVDQLSEAEAQAQTEQSETPATSAPVPAPKESDQAEPTAPAKLKSSPIIEVTTDPSGETKATVLPPETNQNEDAESENKEDRAPQN